MHPIALKPNDIIDVIAPSGGNFAVSNQQVKDFIEGLSYQARVPDDMQLQGSDPFCANTDEARYRDLLAALQAPDSNVIWCFKGGYGAARLLPMLDAHDFSAQPKLLMGFSDITALFLYFHKKYRWPYVHCRMIGQYIRGLGNAEELELIQHVLRGDVQQLKYDLTPVNDAARASHDIRGEIIGGNITLIESSLATNWQIETKGKILFIEDVDVRGYQLHRMLVHLDQAGVFDGILALIIGDIACAMEPDERRWTQNSGYKLCDAALSLFLPKLRVPVFSNNCFGHGDINYPLMLGRTARISVSGEKASLQW
jgi:muramoyltetrapeptide carboxypeptidase